MENNRFTEIINEFMNNNHLKTFTLTDVINYIKSKNNPKDRIYVRDIRKYLKELYNQDKVASSYTKFICIEKIGGIE